MIRRAKKRLFSRTITTLIITREQCEMCSKRKRKLVGKVGEQIQSIDARSVRQMYDEIMLRKHRYADEYFFSLSLVRDT